MERRGAGDAHRLAAVVGTEVIDQDAVAAGLQCLPQLFQGFHFHDQRQVRLGGACGGDRRGHRAGHADVVFLEHHRVVQAEAVVAAAAGAHRVLLRQAQAGQGLAGIQDHGAGAAHRFDMGGGGGGGARQGLQEVERAALGADQGAAAAFQQGQHGAGGHALAFGHLPVDLHPRIQFTVAGVEPGPAGDHRVLLAQQVGAFGHVRQQGGGDVAAAQVLGQGAPHVGQHGVLRRWHRRGHRLSPPGSRRPGRWPGLLPPAAPGCRRRSGTPACGRG